MHRVRQSLPYTRDFACDATVMVVRPELVEGNRDDDLVETLPTVPDVISHAGLYIKWPNLLVLGSKAIRSLPFIARRKKQLLALWNYDSVYFTTPMMPFMS